MIDISYSKAILNLLFGRRANGVDIYEERQSWHQDQGIPSSVSGKQYSNATAEEREKYDQWKKQINQSENWMTKQYEPYPNAEKPTYPGWTIVKRAQEDPMLDKYYPTARYLALFTTMPNADGTGFVEPYKINNVSTTYMRVDLEHAFFSNNAIMDKAILNIDQGGAKSTNQYTIYFPEIVNVHWSTQEQPLVGFGIFANAVPTEGEIPYLWGKLSNTEAVVAATEHVPLFRVGEFELLMK